MTEGGATSRESISTLEDGLIDREDMIVRVWGRTEHR